MSHFVEEDFIMNRTLSRPCLVAVKILRTDAEDRARLVGTQSSWGGRGQSHVGWPTLKCLLFFIQKQLS
ncbi:hypothetical protein DPMN_147955 [Dreissena polymorpha]|uniref:Uncharacterized protein n=1 Tax=Dreissena polymorpha TaxID=45954 RepID=A0A9D4J3V7_DREPO|nr:hypothetical protein DPMN_147955 [Dreissena polymorpha]